MENHPIPQDVTSFQFKLIGNMTVKQFGYIATGVVLAAILSQLPIHILIKLPIRTFLGLFGLALSYLPVSGRPMDLMISNYFKALVSPTLFVYDKTGGQPGLSDQPHPSQAPQPHAAKALDELKDALNPLPKDQLKDYLKTIKDKPKTRVDDVEKNFLTSISTISTEKEFNQQNVSSASGFKMEDAHPNLAVKISSSKMQDNQGTNASEDTSVSKSSPTSGQSSSPSFPHVHLPQNLPFLNKLISKSPHKNTAAITPSHAPNMITGVVKDARGNALPNILIEIKDRENNPVRAFKTNVVGRFASATPLTDGSYTVNLEDPSGQNSFTTTTIKASGQIMPVIEVSSVDKREELRRSLFASGRQSN